MLKVASHADGVRILRYGSSSGTDIRIINVRSTNGGLGVKCVVQRKEGERTAESSLLKVRFHADPCMCLLH